MQIEKAMADVIWLRPNGCCFGVFWKHGYQDDFHLKEALRMAEGIHHELCAKIIGEILRMTPHWRSELLGNVPEYLDRKKWEASEMKKDQVERILKS